MRRKEFEEHLPKFLKYAGVSSPDELIVSDTKGYWKYRDGCPGGDKCKHAFRSVMGPCDGKVELFISYEEYGIKE